MEALSAAEKWELKSLFYLNLLDRTIQGMFLSQERFRRAAVMLPTSVRLVIHKRSTSRAWWFLPDQLVLPSQEEPTGLTLQFESHRLFVKVVEEKTSPIAAILLGSLSVRGSLTQAYAFARLLSQAGAVLSLLRTPMRDGQEEEATLANLSLFYSLFSVFHHFLEMRTLAHPPAPWTLYFRDEDESITLFPGNQGISVCFNEGAPQRMGAVWRFQSVHDLKRGLDNPKTLIKELLTRRLTIQGVGASIGWVKAFIPFIKHVAPLLTDSNEAPPAPAAVATVSA